MKLLLWDIDGTLILTGGAGVRALDRAFRERWGIEAVTTGLPLNGKSDRWIIAELFRRSLGRGPDPVEREEAEALYLAKLAEEVPSSAGYRVMPGIAEVLRALAGRADVVLGLGTGNLERGARIKLERAGLNGFFAFGGYGSDSEDRPTLIRHAIERGGRHAGRMFRGGEVWVIGDTAHDVHAARAVGAVAVTVATGNVAEAELRACDPDHHFSDFSEPTRLLSLL